jgi:hypothetical protein
MFLKSRNFKWLVIGIVVIAIAIWNYYNIKEGMVEPDVECDENPDYCKFIAALNDNEIKSEIIKNLSLIITPTDSGVNDYFKENSAPLTLDAWNNIPVELRANIKNTVDANQKSN